MFRGLLVALAVAAVPQVGTLPQTLTKASAVALPGGRLLVLGGEASTGSIDSVLLGTPQRLRLVGHLPSPTHDAAATFAGSSVLLFGGGNASPSNAIVRVDPATGHAVSAGRLDEPLSDLAAVDVGGMPYIVGGYTGTRYASAILRFRNGRTTTIARLPTGTRYAGVAVLDRRIVVAGGLTSAGPTDAVYSVDPAVGKVRRIATLPAPEDHAGMAVLGGSLYLVGGSEILRIHGSRVSVAARLPVSLSDPAVVALGGRIVIVGGGTNGVYAFTPR